MRTCAISERLQRCVHDKAPYKSTFTLLYPTVLNILSFDLSLVLFGIPFSSVH